MCVCVPIYCGCHPSIVYLCLITWGQEAVHICVCEAEAACQFVIVGVCA